MWSFCSMIRSAHFCVFRHSQTPVRGLCQLPPPEVPVANCLLPLIPAVSSQTCRWRRIAGWLTAPQTDRCIHQPCFILSSPVIIAAVSRALTSVLMPFPVTRFLVNLATCRTALRCVFWIYIDDGASCNPCLVLQLLLQVIIRP